MSIKLWAFKDASDRVRITGNDPSTALTAAGMKVSKAVIPGGFSMRDLRRFFDTTEQTLNGQTGAESFVELELLDLSDADFTALMTGS